MRDPQDKELDGIVFTVRPIAGMRAATFLPRLMKVIGPAFAALADDKRTTAERLREGFEAIGALDEKETEAFIRTLLAGCTFQPMEAGQPGGELLKTFDLTMQGRPEVTFQLLAFAAEVNYGGFFPLLKGLGDRFAPKPSASISPTKKPHSGSAGA